jgi:hypothetical protein
MFEREHTVYFQPRTHQGNDHHEFGQPLGDIGVGTGRRIETHRPHAKDNRADHYADDRQGQGQSS